MKPHVHDKPRRLLRNFGLNFPGAETKSPWPEHLDLVVAGKTFAFLNVDGLALRISCKLPQSASVALSLPFASPTPYGLGRSGWVSAEFSENTQPPVELLKEWILESYRAQAPKRLAAALDAKSLKSEPAPKAKRKDKRAPTPAKNDERKLRASSPSSGPQEMTRPAATQAKAGAPKKPAISPGGSPRKKASKGRAR